MNNNNLIFSLLPEETDYFLFRQKTYDSQESEYQSSVRSLLAKLGKGLLEVRKEIIFGEQHNTLTTPEGERLCLDANTLSLDHNIEKYFLSWYTHDSFAYEAAKNLEILSHNPDSRASTLDKFISNDQLIRIYVSKNLPIILNKLRNKIKDTTEIDLIPAIPSFEIFLTEMAEKAYNNDKEINEFALKYTYGDIDSANYEIKRLYNPSGKAIYERIRKKRTENFNKFSEQLEKVSETVDPVDLHRYLRLSYWAGFEEPRKRYIVEGGIVDYLFRELVYQEIKRNNGSSLLKDTSFCLQVNQEKFEKLIRSQKNV